MGFINKFKEKYVPRQILTKRKLQELKTEWKAEVFTSLHSEMSAELNARDVHESVPSDPFYADVYEAANTESKYATSKNHTKESTSYFRSQGYFTNYSGLDRNQPDEVREYIQDAAYIKAREDPHIASIADNMTQYIVGRGIKFKAYHPKVQQILEEFWTENEMELKQKEAVWRTEVESEFFFLYFLDDERGKVKLREIPPNQITDIELHPDDNWVILSFKREYSRDIDGGAQKGGGKVRYYPEVSYFNQRADTKHGARSEFDGKANWKSDTRMQYVKLGNNREKRSWILMQRILKWVRYYENWLKDRIVLNHERSRVVWLKKVRNTFNDSLTRFKPAPSAGYMLVETDDVEYSTVNANINADDVKEDGLAILYAIAAGWGMPMHILQQRANEQVYASIREGVMPFAQKIVDRQDLWSENFRKMFKVVIMNAAQAKRIPDNVIITRYIDDVVRELWRQQFASYREGYVSDETILHVAERTLRTFIDDTYHVKELKYVPEVTSAIYETCDTLIDQANDFSTRITEIDANNTLRGTQIRESEDDAVSGIDFLNQVNRIVERGINIKIESKNIPVEIIFPDIEKENQKEAAEVLQLHDQMHLASKTTLASRAGYNWNEEMVMMKKEQEFMREYGIISDMSSLGQLDNANQQNSDQNSTDQPITPTAGQNNTDKNNTDKNNTD